MDDSPDDYINDFNNAKVFYKDLGVAMLMQEYKKALADIGSKKMNIGDKVLIRTMFMPNNKIVPPWAVEEAVVIEKKADKTKVIMNAKGGYTDFWIWDWMILEVIKNQNYRDKKKYKQIAEKTDIRAYIQDPAGFIDSNVDQDINKAIESMIKDINNEIEKQNNIALENKNKSTKKKKIATEEKENKNIMIYDEDTGESILIDENLYNKIKKHKKQ